MIEIKKPSADRVYLESVVFPYFAESLKPKIVLSVGVDWYTELYNLYFPESLYLTIDMNPDRNKYCKNGFHLNDNIENVKIENLCDLIIFNGVYGYGVNTQSQYNDTINSLAKLLKPEGVLVFGYNNTPEWNPLSITPDSDFLTLQKTRGPDNLHYTETSHNKHTYIYLQKRLFNTR